MTAASLLRRLLRLCSWTLAIFIVLSVGSLDRFVQAIDTWQENEGQAR